MTKLSSLFVICSLIIPAFSHADQITDFGLHLTTEQMRRQDYRSKVNGDFQVFEKRDDKNRHKVVAQKDDYVAFLTTNPTSGEVGYTKLDSDGRILSQTHCKRGAGIAPFSCSTQTHDYCHTLFSKMENGVFAKLKECNSILKSIPYNSTNIGAAQSQAFAIFAKSFAISEGMFGSKVPVDVNSVEQLLTDYAACSAVKEKLAPVASSAPSSNSSHKETTATK